MFDTKTVIGLVLLAGLTAPVAHADESDDCKRVVTYGDPDGKGGVGITGCNGSAGITVGGPMKDVSMHTPLGGYNGAPQVIGRGVESGVHAVGHGAEHVGGEVAKLGRRIFGW